MINEEVWFDPASGLAEPSAYADDVATAVRRDGLRPERTAAQHLPLTPWAQVEAIARR